MQPFNLSASLSQGISYLSQGAYEAPIIESPYLAATLDILVREKQELQHSLNIEIQRRLMAERDLEALGRQQQ
jgi:hypothetical protein